MIDLTPLANVEQWHYRGGPKLFECLVHDVRLADNRIVAVDAYISASGWHISLYMRDDANVRPSEEDEDIARLTRLLDELEISFVREARPLFFEDKRFVCHEAYSYEVPLEQVAEVLEPIVRQLAEAPDRPVPAVR